VYLFKRFIHSVADGAGFGETVSVIDESDDDDGGDVGFLLLFVRGTPFARRVGAQGHAVVLFMNQQPPTQMVRFVHRGCQVWAIKRETPPYQHNNHRPLTDLTASPPANLRTVQCERDGPGASLCAFAEFLSDAHVFGDR
jgi:hypothetical protein